MPSAKVLGVTATPERLDGHGLGEQFDIMVEGPGVAELIDLEFLSPFRVFSPDDAPDMVGARLRAGDYAVEDLRERIGSVVSAPPLTNISGSRPAFLPSPSSRPGAFRSRRRALPRGRDCGGACGRRYPCPRAPRGRSGPRQWLFEGPLQLQPDLGGRRHPCDQRGDLAAPDREPCALPPTGRTRAAAGPRQARSNPRLRWQLPSAWPARRATRLEPRQQAKPAARRVDRRARAPL